MLSLEVKLNDIMEDDKNSCFIWSLLSKIKQIWYYFLMKTNKCKPDVRLGINLLGNLGTKSFPSMHQSNILKMWIKFYYYSIFAKLELQPEGSHFLIKNTCKNSMRGELLWRFNDKVICSNWNYQKKSLIFATAFFRLLANAKKFIWKNVKGRTVVVIKRMKKFKEGNMYVWISSYKNIGRKIIKC